MHSAPSVNYPVGRSPFAGTLLLLVWLLGAMAVALWWSLMAAGSWRLLLAGLAVGAVGALAARQWWLTPAGDLTWDGEAWNWKPAAGSQEGSLHVAVDLQRWLLLRWATSGSVSWLWLERSRRSDRWDDVRRAVYSRARPEAPRGAQVSAAKT
jgi:toxin CptA